MRKFVKGLVIACAATTVMSFALADDVVLNFPVEFDETCLAENDGYAQVWCQYYAQDTAAYTINKVTVTTADGTEVDVTAQRDTSDIESSNGGNNIIKLTGDSDAGIEAADVDLTAITSATYYITIDADVTNVEAWEGGAVGTNATLGGWKQVYTYGNAYSEDGSPLTDIMLQDIVASDAAADDTTTADDTTAADDTNAADDTTTTEAPAATTDSSAKTGDATSVVALAGLAVVALAGAVVSSKKRA